MPSLELSFFDMKYVNQKSIRNLFLEDIHGTLLPLLLIDCLAEVALQNLWASDVLSAQQGGTCALLGEQRCFCQQNR